MDHHYHQYVDFGLRKEDSIDNNDRKGDENNNNLDLKRGSWTVEEDFTLMNHIALHGEGRWNSLARSAGLKRTGKSCRLRWLNYLRPDVRRGNITLEEQLLILQLHSRWGNRWSKIAQHLPGRTDNEIKNYWRTRVQKQAKQLKCDVNSKEFKDTLHYLWIPRLVERIQASSNSNNQVNIQKTNDNIIITNNNNINNNNIVPNMNFPQENYSSTTTTTSSENSIGTQISDMSDNCYTNYPLNQGDYGEILISPTGGYFQQGDIFNDNNHHQNMSQLFLDDNVCDNLWNIDDMLFLQQQLN